MAPTIAATSKPEAVDQVLESLRPYLERFLAEGADDFTVAASCFLKAGQLHWKVRYGAGLWPGKPLTLEDAS